MKRDITKAQFFAGVLVCILVFSTSTTYAQNDPDLERQNAEMIRDYRATFEVSFETESRDTEWASGVEIQIDQLLEHYTLNGSVTFSCATSMCRVVVTEVSMSDYFTWGEPVDMIQALEGLRAEAAVAYSLDGQTLYAYFSRTDFSLPSWVASSDVE